METSDAGTPARDEGTTQEKETGRIEAFSDGVFAIAITLLVLDLRLPADSPTATATALTTALGELWPTYAAFGISFAFIGIMWINHHRLFTHIRRSDNVLLILNLLLLLGITVLPFPTSLLAVHFGYDGALPAALVYDGLFLFIAVMFNVLWRYAAAGNRLLSPQADVQAVRRITRQYLYGPALYLVAFVLAFVSVPLSVLFSFALAIFFALPGPPLPDTPPAVPPR